MKRTLLLVNLIFVLFLCCGCSTDKTSLVFLEDSVMMDSQNVDGDTFVFCFNYLYQGELPQMEIIAINGEGLQNISYTYEDVTSDFQNDDVYRDFKMGSQGIKIEYRDAVGNTMMVNSVTFLVNGVEKTLEFKYPLEATPVNADVNTYMLEPSMVLNGCGFGSDVMMVYTAAENITLESISLGKYLNLDNITFALDKNSTGNDEIVGGIECLPLEVPKGASFVIRGTVNSDYYNGYQNVYTTSIIRYLYKGVEYAHHMDLQVIGVQDADTLHKAIDYILDNNMVE